MTLFFFSKFFTDKIETIRVSLDSAVTSEPIFSSFSGNFLIDFEPANPDEIKEIILDSATKYCDLDPIPTGLLKKCLPDLLPCITNINHSLMSGTVPDCF